MQAGGKEEEEEEGKEDEEESGRRKKTEKEKKASESLFCESYAMHTHTHSWFARSLAVAFVHIVSNLTFTSFPSPFGAAAAARY